MTATNNVIIPLCCSADVTAPDCWHAHVTLRSHAHVTLRSHAHVTLRSHAQRHRVEHVNDERLSASETVERIAIG